MDSFGLSLKVLWGILSSRNKRGFIYLLLLMLLSSCLEIISIGAVLPFLAALISPEKVYARPEVGYITAQLSIETPNEFATLLTILFGVVALIAGFTRLLLAWSINRVTFTTGADIGSEMFRRTLYQPYAVHVQRNSSEILSAINGKVNNVIYSVTLPLLTIISSVIMLIAIITALMFINKIITISTIALFGLIYLFIVKGTYRRLDLDGKLIAEKSITTLKIIQEGLGGIRDILLDHTQGKYSSLFSKEDLSLRKAQARSMFISQSPRYVIEALGIVMVTLIAYYFSNSSYGVINAIPVLGAFALAAQRLLPILQQIFSSWTGIQSGKKSLQDVVMLLNQPMPLENDGSYGPPIIFSKEIKLNNIRFRYKNEYPWVLKDINLTISKGSRVGIVGSTGCGKSTLMDILLGLLSPTHGDLRVDECKINQTNSRLWQSLISHVPQTIYLSDNSIAENIAFIDSTEDLDMERVRHCAEQAQLSESIERWPKKYETHVGERGIRLSGGQRQRIGIARALYKNASIIMLDEATSALDGETEESVMKVIEGLDSNLTIIIIAHRLTTLRKCTEIITLANGEVSSVSSRKDQNTIL